VVETEDASTLVISDGDEAYDAYGIAPVAIDSEINCGQESHFFGRLNTDPTVEDKYEAWEMATTPGMTEKSSFSIAQP